MEEYRDRQGKKILLLVIVAALFVFWLLGNGTDDGANPTFLDNRDKEKAALSFLTKHMQNSKGGMRTTYGEGSNMLPSGADVLSESQGIVMEYAVGANDQALFDKTLSYVKANRFKKGTMPWVVTHRQTITVNALIDDLRVLGAWNEAKNIWGEDYSLPEDWMEALLRMGTIDSRPVDFYDAVNGAKADRFTLCYGDLKTLKALGKEDTRFLKLYEETLALIEGGYIGDGFPLYYSYYGYDEKRYQEETLHMAEALTTVLHLAEDGRVKKQTIEWLFQRLKEGTLYAAYHTDGSTPKDGYYESTAVYAIAAMIAFECREDEMAELSIKRMEGFFIGDETSPLYGAFGSVNQQEVYSFDQAMALLAYQKRREAKQNEAGKRD